MDVTDSFLCPTQLCCNKFLLQYWLSLQNSYPNDANDTITLFIVLFALVFQFCKLTMYFNLDFISQNSMMFICSQMGILYVLACLCIHLCAFQSLVGIHDCSGYTCATTETQKFKGCSLKRDTNRDYG